MMFFTGLQGGPNGENNMKQFLSFVKKEFAHVLRDRKTLIILFGMPVMQILIFGFALTNEIKNTKIVIVDLAKDQASMQITERISASQYFEIEKSLLSAKDITTEFQKGKIKAAIIIPSGFESSLLRNRRAQ